MINPFAQWSRNLAFVRGMMRVLPTLKAIKPETGYGNLTPDEFEAIVDRYPGNIAFFFGERAVTYREFESLANRIGHWGLDQGLKPGDGVALFMGNRPEFVAFWYGLSKIGVVSALLNHHLVGSSLAHCLNVSRSRHVIVDAELMGAFREAKSELAEPMALWRFGRGDEDGDDLSATLEDMSNARIDPAIRADISAGEPALRMFTSGTTGMPKAADITHVRARTYMNAFASATMAGPTDRMLLALPLYHSTGGLCGLGCALARGGAVILDRKFSASRFWDLASDHGATMMTYVGELCRFLTNSPPHPHERGHNLRVALGNGLRPDVWRTFVERFDVPWVMEFYGATEGNVSLINVDNKVGAVGRMPPLLARYFNARIVRYDFEAGAPMRGPDGRFQQTDYGEVGEMIGEIRTDDPRFRFEGYAGAQKETDKKILTDVFKPGDRWFRTGDLVRMDRHGYVYFVDRAGDTFRWKSENVATSEVAEALSVYPGVLQANVYGVQVPGYDGRAGMAAIQAGEALDFKALAEHLRHELPSYARPVFLRLVQGNAEDHSTGTFKLKKSDLVDEGFNVARTHDPIFVADGSAGYRQLDAAGYRSICAGEVRL